MDIILTMIIMVILITAVVVIVIEKRKGSKCIGCPYSQTGGINCACDHSKKSGRI